jgi:hypothetical protein
LAGLRRSSYGCPARNADHAWWVERASQFARSMSGPERFQPAIVEIVSVYLDNGDTQMEFARPASWTGGVSHMEFNPRPRLDHEAALAAYDRAGVKAILQLEPGAADVGDALEIAHRAFGAHPCVAGYGVDVEWHRTRESGDGAGLAVTDAQAESWLRRVRSFNPRFTLFLKHWREDRMPPSFRDPRLWFLSDSQQFDSLDELTRDFRQWAGHFRGSDVGFQFGYPKDRRWWGRLPSPPLDIGRRLRQDIPASKHLFWVDFTADRVEFAPGRPAPDGSGGRAPAGSP